MKWYKPDKLETRSVFIVIPIVATGCNYLLFGERFLEMDILIKSTAVMIPIMLIIWYAHMSVNNYVSIKYSHYTQITHLITWLLILYLAAMLTMISGFFLGYSYFNFLGYELDLEKYAWAVIVLLFITSVGMMIWGLHHTVVTLRQRIAEQEELEEENLITEIQGWKSQVSPHFLFNSLNSISALIDEDPDEAEAFVDELSKVYRYLLQHTENGLISLSEELDFIRSYFYLLKIRYENGLYFGETIDDRLLGHMLPIHTLQLLVENAVQHNTMNESSPLRITLSTTSSGKLMVSNNLQKKELKVSTSKSGLDNLRNKYRLLNAEEIIIRQDTEQFSVELPLIPKNKLVPFPSKSDSEFAGW